MEEEIDVGEPTSMYAYSSYSMDEDDGPIDMSMKKRPQEPSPPSYFEETQKPPFPSTISDESRPSVITCVARQVVPPRSPIPSFEEPSYPPPPYNLVTQQRHNLYSSTVPVQSNQIHKEEPTSVRRYIAQADTDDSEIDEHFRRSLGQDYRELLVPKKVDTQVQEEPSDSVDDHFNKALGGLWTKLKAENNGVASSGRHEAPPPYLKQPWKHKHPSAEAETLPPPSYTHNMRPHDPQYPLSLSPKAYERDPHFATLPHSSSSEVNPNVSSPNVSRTSS